MSLRISQLQVKEVINVRDGSRLGNVGDLEVDVQTGRIVALVLFGRNRLMGLIGKSGDFIIPWEAITMIGDDTILVDADIIQTNERKKSGFFSSLN